MSARLDEIKVKILDPAIAAADASGIERGISLWHAAAEAEKFESESEKVKLDEESVRRTARTESQRYWVSVLAPLVSAAAVVGALWVQVYQVNQNAALQREANQFTKWRDAVGNAHLPSAVSSLTSMTLIRSFLTPPRYQDKTREFAVSILGATTNLDGYRVLFPAVFPTPDWSSIREAVRLSQMQKRAWNGVCSEVTDL
jgi:hypothetical protein